MRMRSLFRFTVSALPIALISACLSTHIPGWGSQGQSDQIADQEALAGIQQFPFVPVCGRVREGGGTMRCHAKTRANPDGTPQTASTPQGFGPSDLASAYNLPSSGTSGLTVALVDAYDDPTAESDLGDVPVELRAAALHLRRTAASRRSTRPAATTSLPAANSGWAGEISLDLDMVSAACPSCKILLVEANSADDADLGAAVNDGRDARAPRRSATATAAPRTRRRRATSSEYYNHPGVLVTASAGDEAYGAEFPATSQYVLAVGGTSLREVDLVARAGPRPRGPTAAAAAARTSPSRAGRRDTGCSNRTRGRRLRGRGSEHRRRSLPDYGASGWAGLRRAPASPRRSSPASSRCSA